MKIGFVGLGIMGRPMALNLLRSGCELYVNDLNEAAVKALCDKGARAASQAEIAKSCEAVFTILPNGSIVHQVLLGECGMLAHMAPGTLAVDMSSVTPEEAKAWPPLCAGERDPLPGRARQQVESPRPSTERWSL